MYAYCILAVITALFIGQGLGAQVFRNPLAGHAGRPGIAVAAGVLISAARPAPVLGTMGPQPVVDRAEPAVTRSRTVDHLSPDRGAGAPAGHTATRSPQKPVSSADKGTQGSSAQGSSAQGSSAQGSSAHSTAPGRGPKVKVRGNSRHDRTTHGSKPAGRANGKARGTGHGKHRH
jgi:hypothetical protein